MHRQLPLVVLFFAAACQSSPVAAGANGSPDPAVASATEKSGDKTPSADEKREKKQKELRDKERELVDTKFEQQIAAVDREVADLVAQTGKSSADRGLEEARAALDVFQTQQKPRELEDKKIDLDRRTHAADHAKDELGELTAMYDADEFAKATKELVLKRGRRSLEIAERQLAVAKKDFAEFEGHTLPQRERELVKKVDDAEVQVTKAEYAVRKTAMAKELAIKREGDKIVVLEEEIAELKAELAKAKS